MLEDPKRLSLLIDRLKNSADVTRFDEEGHDEAGALALALQDLEQSFREFLENQLPKLVDNRLGDGELTELLLDMGEEFRHILYHLHDPKYFRYLFDDQYPSPTSSP